MLDPKIQLTIDLSADLAKYLQARLQKELEKGVTARPLEETMAEAGAEAAEVFWQAVHGPGTMSIDDPGFTRGICSVLQRRTNA